MSVKKSDRNESHIQFVATMIDLEVFAVKKLPSKPSKLKFFYRDYILNPIIEAMNYVKSANSINIKFPNDYLLRRKYLLNAYCNLQSVLSQMDIYFRIYKYEGTSKNEIKNMLSLIDEELRLLNGVIKSDEKRFSKLIDNN